MIFPADPTPDSSARNVLSGKVIKVQPIGLFFKLQIDCGFLLSAYVTSQAMDDLHVEAGMQAIAAFKATAVHVIKKS